MCAGAQKHGVWSGNAGAATLSTSVAGWPLPFSLQLLRGLASGMQLEDFSMATQWEPLALEALTAAIPDDDAAL